MFGKNLKLAIMPFVVLVLLIGQTALAASNQKPKITICNQPFALCAASTGTITGQQVTVKAASGELQIFPEALVTCPIVTGSSIAGLNLNQMGNTCKAPPGFVYSLFWSLDSYPQEGDQWITTSPIAQACKPVPTTITTPTYPNGGATQAISQCWGIKCKITDKLTPSGNPLAECRCPYGEYPTGGLINPTTVSSTFAGYGNASACSQYPVAGTLPNSLRGK